MTTSTATIHRLEEIIRRLRSGEPTFDERIALCAEGHELVEAIGGRFAAVGEIEEVRLSDIPPSARPQRNDPPPRAVPDGDDFGVPVAEACELRPARSIDPTRPRRRRSETNDGRSPSALAVRAHIAIVVSCLHDGGREPSIKAIRQHLDPDALDRIVEDLPAKRQRVAEQYIAVLRRSPDDGAIAAMSNALRHLEDDEAIPAWLVGAGRAGRDVPGELADVVADLVSSANQALGHSSGQAPSSHSTHRKERR